MFHRGFAYGRLDQFDTAIADYDRALELDPRHVDAYRHRGLAYYDLQDHRQAIDDFDQAIELDPTSAEIFEFRGNSWCRLGQGSRAYDDWLLADGLADADRRRNFQRISMGHGHFEGPATGEASMTWQSAIAYRAPVTC